MRDVLLTLVLGYLYGSVSIPRLVFRLKRPGVAPEPLISYSQDGKATLVAHQVGATNVMLAFGRKWGMATTLLDVLKLFLPMLLLRLRLPGTGLHLLLAGAIYTGVLWPVWHRFQGGGGNSAILGVQLAVSPLGLLFTQGGGMFLAKRIPALTFAAGVLLMPLWFALRFGPLSPETGLGVYLAAAYLLGQMPEAREKRRLEREGHFFDMEQILEIMRNPQGARPPKKEEHHES